MATCEQDWHANDLDGLLTFSVRAVAGWTAMVVPCVAADAVPAAIAVSPAPRHKSAAATEILRIPLFLEDIPAP